MHILFVVIKYLHILPIQSKFGSDTKSQSLLPLRTLGSKVSKT